MRSLLSIVRPFHFALILAVAIGSAANSKSATLYGNRGTESASGPLPYVAGDGGLSIDSLIFFQNATSGISESFSNSDPASAAAYVASISENRDRDAALGAYILSISMGSSEKIADSSARNSALRLAMERWLAASEGGESGGEIPGGDNRGRGRERGGENSDREIALNWINSDYYADSILPDYSSGVSVPEPSVSVLGALAGLGLLRRRRK